MIRLKFTFLTAILITVYILVPNNEIIAQTRCDTLDESIFFVTEELPESSISMSQVASVLNTSIDLNKYQVPNGYSIYVNFIINCEGEDFNYRVIKPEQLDENLELELLTTLQNTLTWSAAKQRGKGVDFSKTINILVENNEFRIVENSQKELLNQEYTTDNYRALGGNIFLGYGKLNGNIANYITDPIFVGINVDIHRQRLVIQIDDYIGFGKVKKTMDFPDDLEWSKNKAALHFMLGGNLGYTLINSNSIKIVPLGGVGFDLLSSTFMGSSDNKENEPFLPYYKLGCYFDIKSLRLFRNNYSFNYDDGYTCVRLSLGLNTPIGKPKFDEFYSGSMFYFTIGMGGLSRQ